MKFFMRNAKGNLAKILIFAMTSSMTCGVYADELKSSDNTLNTYSEDVINNVGPTFDLVTTGQGIELEGFSEGPNEAITKVFESAGTSKNDGANISPIALGDGVHATVNYWILDAETNYTGGQVTADFMQNNVVADWSTGTANGYISMQNNDSQDSDTYSAFVDTSSKVLDSPILLPANPGTYTMDVTIPQELLSVLGDETRMTATLVINPASTNLVSEVSDVSETIEGGKTQSVTVTLSSKDLDASSTKFNSAPYTGTIQVYTAYSEDGSEPDNYKLVDSVPVEAESHNDNVLTTPKFTLNPYIKGIDGYTVFIKTVYVPSEYTGKNFLGESYKTLYYDGSSTVTSYKIDVADDYKPTDKDSLEDGSESTSESTTESTTESKTTESTTTETKTTESTTTETKTTETKTTETKTTESTTESTTTESKTTESTTTESKTTESTTESTSAESTTTEGTTTENTPGGDSDNTTEFSTEIISTESTSVDDSDNTTESTSESNPGGDHDNESTTDSDSSTESTTSESSSSGSDESTTDSDSSTESTTTESSDSGSGSGEHTTGSDSSTESTTTDVSTETTTNTSSSSGSSNSSSGSSSGGGGGHSHNVSSSPVVKAGEHGKLVYNTTKDTYKVGNKNYRTPTPVADEGYEFVYWLLNNSEKLDSITGKEFKTQDKVIATFMPKDKEVVADPDIQNETYRDYMKENYPNVEFYNEGSITRGELVGSLFITLTDGTGTDKTSQFTDINSNDWYTPAINYYASIGVIRGYGDGTFRPAKAITKGELSSIIYGLAGLDKISVPTSQTAEHWAEHYAQCAVAAGYLTNADDLDSNISRTTYFEIVKKLASDLGLEKNTVDTEEEAQESVSDTSADLPASNEMSDAEFSDLKDSIISLN